MIKELAVFCRKKLFVIPLNSLEIFFQQLKIHMHFAMQENDSFIATTFSGEYKFLENFVESYVQNIIETFSSINSVLDLLSQNNLLVSLKRMNEKELLGKLLADQTLFMDVNSDLWISCFDLLKLKLTTLELLVALNRFVPQLIDYFCVQAKQSFELFKSELDATKDLLLFFEKLDSVKLQIVEQKESFFQKLLKSITQGKNNRFLTKRIKPEQSHVSTFSKSKTIVPGFFHNKSVDATLNVLPESTSSNQPIKKRDELLDKLDPKLNQAYEKIQLNQIDEACNLYREILNLPFTKSHAFSLIHAAWGLADCLKAQSISIFKTELKKKLIKQARCLYEKALVLIDKTAMYYAGVESVINELDTYREFIWQELNIYAFKQTVMQIWYLWLQKKYEQLNLKFEFTMPVELKDCFVMEHFLNANALLNLEKLVNRISLLPVEFPNHTVTLKL